MHYLISHLCCFHNQLHGFQEIKADVAFNKLNALTNAIRLIKQA